jgi:diadenosine tetraphosphate (Ap4A) HIT family hydrolase
MIAGFEVPHVHVHVVPINGMGDLDFTNADTDPDQAALDELHQQRSSALGS